MNPSTIIAGLSGLVAGLLLAPLVIQSAPPSSQEGIESVALPALPQLGTAEALNELREEMQRLQVAVAGLARSESRSLATRAQVDAAAPEKGNRSIETLARLEEILSELRLATQLTNSTKRLVVPRGLPAMIMPTPGTPEFSRAISKLMSYQEVLDLYGVPMSVTPGDGNQIKWKFKTAGGSTVELYFADGLLFGSM